MLWANIFCAWLDQASGHYIYSSSRAFAKADSPGLMKDALKDRPETMNILAHLNDETTKKLQKT